MEWPLWCLGSFVIVIVVMLFSAIRIIKEYERIVVFRVGRLVGARGPGVIFIIPIIEKGVVADLRETVMEIPRQTSITKDNAPINIDFLIYWRIIDPSLSVVRVKDFRAAAVGIATTTLRAVIGDIMLDDVLAKREQINTVLQSKLDEVTERWGVKITAVEIREIEPPREVQDAMNRQMTAERVRRATVTEAEGARQAAILRAEGEKQAAILQAEGGKQSVILAAEGEQTSQQLRAQGYAQALEEIYKVAQGVDDNTMTLQYLTALRDVGSSPSTKFIFPMELTGLLRRFMDLGSKQQDKSG
ncbi:MAG: SPFH/Band 7/PHB domain protein [Anaerolineae bacterium]|nr:SPFH/Band 7/PHB domain protein [Anaerolineae bacterium]